MNNDIIERIKAGTRPTEILKEQKALHPELTSHELADWLHHQDTGFPSQAFPVIWHWKHARRNGQGLDDELLDRMLLRLLRDEGVLQPGEGPVVPEPAYRLNRESAVKLAREVAAKTNAKFDPDAKYVMKIPLPEPKEGGQWLVSFDRLEPDQQDRAVNVFIRDQTGEARLRSWRND